MKTICFFALFASLISLTFCNDNKKSIYDGCCGTDATIDSFLIPKATYDPLGNLIDSVIEVNLFIPNVFIPDTTSFAAHFDMTFRIGLGPGVFRIVSSIYTDERNEVLYKKENYLPDSGNKLDGWNGIKSDGSIHYGPFEYLVTVEFVDGQNKTYVGKACAVKCDDDGFPSVNIPKCLFPAQNNGKGLPDPNLPGSYFCL